MSQEAVRVLFADDAPEMLSRLVELVADMPVEIVATAKDGEEALRLYLEHRPDIAIIDLQMPKLNGIQVVSAIRQQDGDAFLVMLTHLDSREFHHRALRAGADRFLSKHSEFEILRDVIDAFRRREGQ